MRLQCPQHRSANVQDPRCYSVHVSSSSEHAQAYEGSCGRTETAQLCMNPEFINSSFLIRLPHAMGTSLKPQTLLTCQLWATPSVEKGVAHIAADGRISDELVGEGAVHVIGEAASRMLRGQRVHVSAKLSTSATLYPAAVATAFATAKQGARTPEILLELMLIDTMISLPQDSLLAARPLGSSQIGPTEGYSAMPGSSQCALFVLVSSAQGLPLLPAAASTSAPQPAATDAAVQTRAPSAFVAVKAARDIVNGGAVQGTTRVVGQQCNPVWEEVLVVRYVEQELKQERLVFAIMDDVSARPIATCSLPLQNIEPGYFYNFAVPVKTTTKDAVLRVTLCLSASPCHEVSRWRSFQDKSLGPVNIRVAGCSADFASIGAAGDSVGSATQNTVAVAARFEIANSTDSAAEQTGTDAESIKLYTELTGEPKEDSEIIAKVSETWSLLGPVMLPLVGANSNTELLWPVSRMALLALPAGVREHGGLKVTLYKCSAAGDATRLGSSVLQLQNLPEDGDGALVPFSDLPFKCKEEDSALSLEVRYWTSAAYMEMLNAAAPMGVDPKEWKLPPDPLFTAPVATAANSLGLASLFQCLVEDSMQKQIALEHVQCGADGATQRCEISAWRLRDLDGRNRALSGDVEALRRMLHESKEGTIPAAEMEQLSGLNSEQLLARCHAYAARAQMERTRCAEVLKRLKDMHANDVDSKRLSAHMGELQRAHVLQNRVIQELEEGLGRMPLLKSTVRKQEKVIAGLEDLLRKAVQQVKCMRDAEASVREARQSAESRSAEADRRAAAAEQRVVKSDRSATDDKAKLQAAHAQTQAVRMAGAAEQQSAAQPPQPQAHPMQQRAQEDVGAAIAPVDTAKVADLEQQLKWEQRELEALRRQLEGERADSESLRRQQTEAVRESETLRRKVVDIEQQMVELRQRVVTAASDAEALKSRADASDEAADAADSDLAQATAMYAREIAQMKARLVEKDAELLGGFGSPAKLVDTQWSVPPMTPLQINPRPDAAFLERHFGFASCAGVHAEKAVQHDRARSIKAQEQPPMEGSQVEHIQGVNDVVAEPASSGRPTRPPSGASQVTHTSKRSGSAKLEPAEEVAVPRSESSQTGSGSSNGSSSSGDSGSSRNSSNSS